MTDQVTQQECAEREMAMAGRLQETELRIITSISNEISSLKGDIRLLKLKSAGVWATVGSVFGQIIAEILKHWGNK